MRFRVRKSWNLGPLRINLSKSGIGYSVGTKGFRVTKKARGGYRTTASIPGTGLSYVKDYGKTDKKKGEEKVQQQGLHEHKPKKPFPWRWVIFGFFVFATVMFLPTLGSLFMAVGAVLSFPKGPIAAFWTKTMGFRAAQVLVLVLLTAWSAVFANSAPLLQTDNGTEISSPVSLSSSSSGVGEDISSSASEQEEEAVSSSSSGSFAPSEEQVAQPSQSEPVVTPPPVTEPVTPPASQEPSSEAPVVDVEEETVYVARSNGKIYHIKKDCSGMKNPIPMTKAEAIKQGKEPCENCAQ